MRMEHWRRHGILHRLLLLQGIFDFQCMMDGAVVRYWKALLAPVLPLIFLILCGFFELVKRGSGCLIARYVYTLQENLKTSGFITSCLQLTRPDFWFTGSSFVMTLSGSLV